MRRGNPAVYLEVGALVPLSLRQTVAKLLFLGFRSQSRRLGKKLLQELGRGLAFLGDFLLDLGGVISGFNQRFLPSHTINGGQEAIPTLVPFSVRNIHELLGHADQALGIQFLPRVTVCLQRCKEEVQQRGNGRHAQAAFHLVKTMTPCGFLQAYQKFTFAANIGVGRQNFTHGFLFLGLALQELG
jgi:hypothetical protein